MINKIQQDISLLNDIIYTNFDSKPFSEISTEEYNLVKEIINIHPSTEEIIELFN